MKNLDNPEIKRGDKNSIFPLGDYILNQLWNIIQFYTNFLENNSLNTKTCNVPPPERHRFPKGLSYDSQQQEIEDKYRLEKSILRTLDFGEALLTSKSVVQFISNLLIPSYLGAGIKVILETQPERENSELFGLHKNAPQKQDLFIYKENYLPLTKYAVDFYMNEAGKSQPYKWIEYISKLDKSAISPKEIMLGLDIINEKLLNDKKLSKEEGISYAFWNYRDNFSIYSAIYNKIKEQYEQIMVPADIPFFTRGIEKGKEIEELFGIKDKDLQKLFIKDPTLGGVFDWRKVLFGSGQSGNKSNSPNKNSNISNKDYELDSNSLNIENKSFVIDYSSDWLQSLNNYAGNTESELAKLSSSGQMGNGFTMGEGINIPLQYEIEVTGLEQFENIKVKAEEMGEAVEESRGTLSNFSSEMVRQFLELDEEKRAALSVDLTMLPLNMMGIGGAPFQFSLPVEESKQFSDTLSDVAHIAGQLGGVFMNVNENIGKAIGSAGGFAGGISNILSALKMDPLAGKNISKMTPEQIEAAREQGEKQKGLALMGGIQGAFGGLQGLFGGEPGSDTSQLLGVTLASFSFQMLEI